MTSSWSIIAWAACRSLVEQRLGAARDRLGDVGGEPGDVADHVVELVVERSDSGLTFVDHGSIEPRRRE